MVQEQTEQLQMEDLKEKANKTRKERQEAEAKANTAFELVDEMTTKLEESEKNCRRK